MTFQEQINIYIEKLPCTSKELSAASELSAAVISRYRSGEREPASDSEQLQKLAAGITRLVAERNISDLTDAEEVLSALQNSLEQRNVEYDNFVANFNTLITELDINMKVLASATNYDTSYLYRVRSGQRHPNDLGSFCHHFCRFITTRYNSPSDKAKVSGLLGCTADELSSDADYLSHLSIWLYQAAPKETIDDVENFLKKLDEFDLDEYIRAIHFDELKVPSMPFHLPTSKTYYGLEEMKKGELDFFKTTVLSKSRDPVFMCSDMQMDDLAEDLDFGKKWMFAIAMTLKKGLHLNMIHNINRPFHEMMLGLESWIPIYMTGQVSPYHLPDAADKIYQHLNYVSGSAALTGECIQGYHKHGKYYLTNNKEEVAYYKQKAVDLLTKAQPLMEIFRAPDKTAFQKFLADDSQEAGNRHNILSSLPLYTISEKLLQTILNRSHLSDANKIEILAYVGEQKAFAETILGQHIITDEIPEMSQQEFESHPVSLSLSGIFQEAGIFYTWQEYQEHLQLTRSFAEEHSNYTVKASSQSAFRNIQIHILEEKYVLISKEKTPVIHFVIRHPKMLHALSNFITPISE